MANMSYVRFENTFKNLKDCYEHLDDDDYSASEQEAREDLIDLCVKIADEFEETDEDNIEEEEIPE